MRVLAITVNYRTAELTARAVDAALAAAPAGHEMRVFLVDNASGDGSVDALRRSAQEGAWGERVQIVPSTRNAGFGAGNNLALAEASRLGFEPDLVYLFNPDSVPQVGTIAGLIDYLDARPGVGIAGSFVHSMDGKALRCAFRFPSLWGELEASAKTGVITRWLAGRIVAPPIPEASCEMDWVTGCSMMVRKAVIDQVGFFDEKFFLYYEETDFCRRAAQASWASAFVRESVITHEGSASTGLERGSGPVPAYWFDSRWRYFCKQHGVPYAAACTLAHVAGGALWRLRKLTRPDLGQGRDPERFLTDLSRHAFKSLLRAAGAGAGAR